MTEINWRAMSAPDAGEFAAWMLSLLDEGDERFATIEIPRSLPEGHSLDDVVNAVMRAYDRAKRDRPNLAVTHRWVGGRCANGCSETRADAN